MEPTSGNTGVGLAIAAAIRATAACSSCPTRSRRRSARFLRGYGAEVVICPTVVPPESPESYYSVSNRLAEEIPGAFKPDQYSNEANPDALRDDRARALEQTGGEIDAIVFSVGTGGTITGTARYSGEEARPPGRRRRPRGLDLSQPDNVHPYLVEGIGEDFWPNNVRPIARRRVRDRVRRRLVPDGAATRARGRAAGRRLGWDGGTGNARRAAPGPQATLVTLDPGLGRGYLSKLYDDNRLMEHGLVEREAAAPTIEEVLAFKRQQGSEIPELVTVESHQKVGEAIDLMQRYSISQIPVVRHDGGARSQTSSA